MKRNMDLIRLLLLRSEGDEAARVACEQFSLEERGYHVQLLIDAKLIEGEAIRGPEGHFIGAVVARLTWAGHDFLESVRDDTLWAKAKKYVLKPGVSWSFDLLKEWAKHEAKLKLGMPV
jgi:hypothetical protein